ncbi:MAG: hypothetical protein E6Q97_33800 [Desulfurellales bacterium]|nr:MAG: hypothetical protein E6Q97_33800 [Desulfurellales bacterium]
MSDYYTELTKPEPAAAKTATAAPSADWYKEISGGAEMRAQPAGTRMPSPDAPGIEDSFGGSAPFTAQLKAGFSPDVQKQIKIFANSLGLPESRFGVVEGNIVYADRDGRIKRATPSVSGAAGPVDAFMRFGQWLGSQVGPSLPGAAGSAAGVATAPFGGGIPGAAAGAGAADVVRQGVGNYFAGSDVTDIDLLNSAGQAAMGGAGQAGGALINRAFQRNPLGVQSFERAAARDPARVAESEALVNEARARGVDLSAGQATGLRSLQMQERQLGRFPETADRMADFIERQRQTQVPDAIRAEANRIAADRGGEAAIEGFREGAGKVVAKEVSARRAAARPAYELALDNREPFINEPLTDLLKRPTMGEAWTKAKRLAADDGRRLPEYFETDDKGNILRVVQTPDWRAWDYIKQGVDDVVEANKNAMTGEVNSQGRAASNLKRQMLEFLDRANPDYPAARAIYGTASESVEAVLDGGVGMLQKMKGPERQAMVDNIFGARALMPEEVGRMRGLFKDAGQLEQWNQGVRQFISGKLDAALKAENVPQAFYKSMEKDPAQRRVLRAAIGDPELVAGWEKLMRVLDASRKGLPEGSPTATDLPQMLGPQTVGTAARVMGAAASPSTYLDAGNKIVAAVDQLRTPAARLKLADALLNPDAVNELKKLRMLPPWGEKTVLVTSRLLSAIGLGATGATSPADAEIPDAREMPLQDR